MLDVAIRRVDGSTVVDWQRYGVRATPPLPVDPALRTVLPDGLRRGSTVSVTGSVSLLFALLGAASSDGAWCALVGFPRVSAEAAVGYGIDLRRLALVPAAGADGASGWTTAVGALLDAVDVVVVRPPVGRRGLPPGDVRRLAARARSKDAVLMPFVPADTAWPGADVRLRVEGGEWSGIGVGSGRLRSRRVTITAAGRGPSARPRSAELLLPGPAGTLAEPPTLAPVIDLAG